MLGSLCILAHALSLLLCCGRWLWGRGHEAREAETDAVFSGRTWPVRGSGYCSVWIRRSLDEQVHDAIKTQVGWSSEQILTWFARPVLFLELTVIFHCRSLLAPLFTVLCVMTLAYFLGLLLTHITLAYLMHLVWGALQQINNECIDLAVSLCESFCLCFILRGLMPMLIRHPTSPVAGALCSPVLPPPRREHDHPVSWRLQPSGMSQNSAKVAFPCFPCYRKYTKGEHLLFGH